jgi:hypothetical protein
VLIFITPYNCFKHTNGIKTYRQDQYPFEKDVSITFKRLLMERTSQRFQLNETAKNSLIALVIFAIIALVSYLQWKITFM